MRDIKLRSLFLDESPDAVIAVGKDGIVKFWNKGAEEMFGYLSTETIGCSLNHLIIPNDKVDEMNQILEKCQKEGSQTYETTRTHKNGSLIFVTTTLKLIAAPDGSVEYFLSSEKDITHIKLQRDTKQVEARFSSLLESTPDGVVIVNTAGLIVLANSTAIKMFGYDKAELRGKQIEVLLPERFRNVHIGHRSNYFHTPHTRTMGAGLELYGLRKNGTEFPVEISLSPLTMEDGYLVMSAIRDISERKKAEEKFRGLLESAPDAIVIVNKEGNIVIVNSQAEKIFLYDRRELIGKPIKILIPSRFHSRHSIHREHYNREPKMRPMGAGLELFGVRKNGEEFPVEISLSPLETEDGILISSAIRDITQRKLAEAVLRDRTLELEAANKELEAFSYSVSHDLRAPLRAINGFCSILLKENAEELSEEIKRYLILISQNTVQMGNLVDDLLKFSRLNRQQIQKEKINLNELLIPIVEQIQTSQKERDISFEIKTLPDSHADKTLLRQVLVNLISNAVKFTKKDTAPKIEIGYFQENEKVIYFVKDNGVGFDMEYAGKLFGVFQRLHLAEEFEGTGVGLALVQRIIHRHGGKVWAESVLNQGSTFYFTLENE